MDDKMNGKEDLKKFNREMLLCLYSDLMEELRKRKIIRSSNNPVADYAEYLAAKKFKLTLTKSSNKGFDAVDGEGLRYQIKSRRITGHNQSRQLSVIRNLDDKPFDVLVAILFNSDFSVNTILKIPRDIIKEYSRFSKHQNGHILVLRDKIIGDSRIVKYKQ